LTNQWISHKEKIIKAWTNKILHYGTTVTSRAEGFQSYLKCHLPNSIGNLKDVVDQLVLLLRNRNIEHQAEIEKMKTHCWHQHLQPIFTACHRIVSPFALEKVREHM
jgi:hypothetical protein